MFDIFICYSRIEIDFVHSLNLELKSFALNVWVDYEQIHNESNWLTLAQQAVHESKFCLIVVNQELINSQSCLIEIETITFLRKPVILIFRSNNLTLPKYLSSLNLIYSCDFFSSIEPKNMLSSIALSIVQKINSLSTVPQEFVTTSD